MSRRKPLAALAAVTAALAVAVPTASASAATTAPARTAYFAPGSLVCRILIQDIRWATMTGNIALDAVLGRVAQYSGCGGAAI